jgi:hypothetical protein|tara:strand:- start:2681 stop:3118 length:438 start_codon:yes stop_codon:yes gene_type:complete
MARKKQGYNARLDDSMGGRSGSKSQSEKSRRDESEGMEKSMGRRKFAGAGTMDVDRKKMARGGSVGRTAADSQGKGHAGSVRKYHASGGFQSEANRPGGIRGFRKGGLVTMKSSNTTVRGPHGSTATAENTNQHKLDAMGKLKGQ